MSSYYYLAASLPVLSFGIKPPLSYGDFIEDCRRLMPSKDFAIIEKATLIPTASIPTQNYVLDAWIVFDRNLRNEMVKFRSTHAKKDPTDFLRGEKGVDPFLANIVLEATKAPDPLTAERFIDKTKWQRLEELEQGYYFDIANLITYAIKLQILERYQAIESPKGQEVFHQYKNLKFPGDWEL